MVDLTLGAWLGTLLVAALLMSGRPFLTVLVLFVVPRVGGLLVAGEAMPGLEILGAAVLICLVLLEHWVWGQDTIELLFEGFQILGALVVVATWAGLVLLPWSRDPGGWADWLWLGGSLGLALFAYAVVSWGRLYVWRVLRYAGLSSVANWVESLSVAGVALTAVLAPMAALVIAALVAIPLVVGPWLVRWIEGIRDRRARRPCPACGHAARVEASRCPACLAHLEVQHHLGAKNRTPLSDGQAP